MLVNRAIPALYNGVSQQPPTLRLPSQAEQQINAWSTVVEGLRQRPSTQSIAKISNSSLNNAHLHIINRTTTQRYIVVVTNGNLQVYDFAGNQKTVTFPNGKGYLTNASPNNGFALTSVADYTFVTNKNVTVAMKAVAADQTAQPTNYYSLQKQIPGGKLGFTGANIYSYAYQTQYAANPSGGSFRGTVQTFDYLPGGPSAPNGTPAPNQGDIWEVQGDSNSNFTAYYVIYQGGVWNETVAPGLQNALDETTMPWALVHEANDTFTFCPFSWAPRRVGDETTNPNPSFVGRTINDVFFYQNRLGLLHDENIVCSRAGDFGNYYRLTVLQLLDDEVVDIGASETSVTNMTFAVPFATGLSLFSDQTQFRLVTPLEGTFSPTTISLQVATRYIASTTVRPVMLGSDIYFISEDDSFAHLREYFVKLSLTGMVATDAEDVSAHVPSYLPKGVYMLAGSVQHDAVFAATTAQPTRLYVYKFYWASEQQKAQSAWSYWDFGTGNSVLQAAGLDDYLWLVMQRADGTYIEKMSLAVGANVGLTDNNGNLYDINLDRRVLLTGVATGSPGNYTTFTLPYSLTPAEQAAFRIVAGPGYQLAGAMADPSQYTWVDSSHVQVPFATLGSFLASQACICGLAYTMTYQFSEQFILNQNNVAVISGRLTLKNWRVYYTNCAFFKFEVDPYGNGNPAIGSFVPTDESSYSGMSVGSQYLTLGVPNFRTGRVEFGVFGESKEATVTLINDTPYPVSFFEAEWEGDYNNRGRTI